MGYIFEEPGNDAYLLYPTNQPWHGPPSHGFAATLSTAAAHPEIIPRDLQHT